MKIVHRIHDVCSWCTKKCKQPYTFWSGMMPSTEYCEKFVDKEGRE